MRLINDKKRFEFIKNQIVELDQELPKYLKLKVVEEAGLKYEAVDPNNQVNVRTITENTAQPDEGQPNYLHRQRTELVHPMSMGEIDKNLRDIIVGMKTNDIRRYLGSKDAEEFNKMFMPILLGELNNNKASIQITPNRWIYEDTPVAYCENKIGNKPTLLESIKNFFNSKKSNGKDDSSEYTMTLLDLFDIIHVEAGKEREFVDRLEGYFTLIRNAALMHQHAQMDELCQKVVLNVYESVLAIHGFNRYITFGNIEKLQGKCKVVLDINYVKNFGRVIPTEVIEKKAKADNLCVFDNYCVLYYDPEGRTYKATATEKRDPILFGLINHSDKLYYIADWVDDKCDLTLEAIAEKLGKEVIEEIKDPLNNQNKK